MVNNISIQIKDPLILSFEYNKNLDFTKNIIDYINNKNIQTISITNLIPIKYIKKIKSRFISIDIDYFEPNYYIFKKLEKYNNYVGQIRIYLEGPFITEYIIKDLDKIKHYFKGSIIILYKNNISNIDIELTNKFIKNLLSKKNIFSFFPIIDVTENDIRYKNIIKLLEKNKNNILKGKILLDNPIIYKQITGKSVICPNNFGIHIDYYGNIKVCKYSNTIIGNIKEKNISDLYNLKQKYQVNLKFKDCFLYNENTIYPYQLLSKFYDKMMGNKNDLYFKYLNAFIELGINKESRIVDLGSGTGNFLYFLSKNGYVNINGIEKSKNMLEIANKKLGEELVLEGDFSNFKFTNRANVITSTFDSLNYITDTELLLKIFVNIFNNLENNGYFIFDINISKKFKNHFNLVQEYIDNENKINLNSSYKKPFWRIKIDFLNSNNNNIFSESHFEILKSKTFIFNLLKKINFKVLKYDENNGRLFIICKKP